jgi:hypothetical protein
MPIAMNATRAVLLAAIAAGVLTSAPAAVADSCSYDAATRTVTALHDQGFGMSVYRSGKTIRINSYSVGDVPCGAATVRNTDTIIFRDTSAGGGFNGVGLFGGPLAPGATKELTGKSEIEITFIGNGSAFEIDGQTTKPNKVTIGSGGFGDPTRGQINLNGDDDADITYSGMGSGGALGVFGGSGADRLSAGGGNGTGGAALTQLFLRGAPNGFDPSAADTLTGGAGATTLQGGGGNDTITAGSGPTTIQGFGGNDTIHADNGAADTVDGGDGTDKAFVDCALDTVSNVESKICR